MKLYHVALVLVALNPWPAFAASAPTSAVAAVTGTVTGRVVNVATGAYLNKVRVIVKGSDRETYTDESGTFRIAEVPVGRQVLEIFYTGLDRQEIRLEVGAGTTPVADIGLTSVERYGQTSAILKLDPVLVASVRETDAEAIAINEQRFAPNVKNVVATDSLGDIVGSSAGDFLKFLPGLVAEYDNAEVAGISVRGIGTDLTTVQLDGAPAVTSGHAGATHSVNLIAQSINNLSRVEVTKVPTPSSPADSLAGSLNMISKSAFERRGAEFRYGVNLTGNLNALTLQKTPHSYGDAKTRKIIPGFDFDYTLPLSRNFGVVITGMSSRTFNSQNISRKTWNSAGTATGASFSQPFLQQFQLSTAPRHRGRTFYGFKADWRVTPNSVLSASARVTRTISAQTGTVGLTPNAGTIGTPATPGVAFRYGPDFTIGATGRGGLTLVGSRQNGQIDGDVAGISYRLDDGTWKLSGSVDLGRAISRLNPGADGPFTAINAVNAVPVRVSFLDIGPERPGSIEVFNSANEAVDVYDAGSYRMTTATRDMRRNVVLSRFGRLDLGRRISIFSAPATLQVGGLHRNQARDRRETPATWTFSAANANPTPYLARVYVNQEAFLGFQGFPPISAVRAWEAYQQNPAFFTQTLAQQVANETSRRNASEYASEKVSAGYIQGEVRLLKGRLHLLSGVRYERTETGGQGTLFDPNAVFQRNANGTFVRNAQGARVRRPEAGAAGSLAEAELVRVERGYSVARNYDGYYPSLHVTYNVRENFLARAAYARTYGRPDFADTIPNATIQEADLDGDQLDNPAIVRGNITIRNTGLKPWTADNYDLSFEYYTAQGGLFSAGGFIKEIDDFFGTSVRLATLADLAQLGLDERYVGWNLSTKFNSGSARVSGVEFNARHTLRELGSWGRYVTVFANATQLRLEGNPHGSFESFVPRTANWGLSLNWKRLTVSPKWNYRGLNKRIAQPAFGPDGFQYIKARTILDLSAAYRVSARLALTVSFSNVFNDELTQMHYGSQTPDYARRSLNGEYGTAFSVGLRGSF